MDQISPVVIPTSEIVVRLADEGIPVYAIARSLRLPPEDVRDFIRTALDDGVIVDHPRDDWSPGSKRATRSPDIDGFFGNDEGLYRTCSKYFKTTRQQSIVLGLLLRRPEVTKENLHQAIERDRPDGKEQTSQKLVDVLVCILRRKLKPFEFSIKTMWGHGYLMDPKDRTKAIADLHAFVNTARDLSVVELQVAA